MVFMKASTLIQVVCAAHHTSFVESPWRERGGILLVAPPGQMKSTWLEFLKEYYGVYMTTDLNSQMLARLKDDMVSDRIKTIVIPDFQKLYKRHPMVSANLEATLQAVMEEGFIASSFQDASIVSQRARALLITACVPSFHDSRSLDWRQSGFLRRLLVLTYSLKDSSLLMDSVEKWHRIEVAEGIRYALPNEGIPYNLTRDEARKIRHFLRAMPEVTPFVLMQKIACVLRWRWLRLKRKGTDPTMSIMYDLSECLHGEGAKVVM